MPFQVHAYFIYNFQKEEKLDQQSHLPLLKCTNSFQLLHESCLFNHSLKSQLSREKHPLPPAHAGSWWGVFCLLNSRNCHGWWNLCFKHPFMISKKQRLIALFMNQPPYLIPDYLQKAIHAGFLGYLSPIAVTIWAKICKHVSLRHPKPNTVRLLRSLPI